MTEIPSERTEKVLPCCGFKIWSNPLKNISSFGWSIFHDSGLCANCIKKVKQPRVMVGRDETQEVFAVPELAGL